MNAGKTFFDLTLAESVPAGSLYAVEMGDGSGTKRVTHEKVVESVGKSLPLGDIKNLQTIAKDNFVNAINEIKQKSESGGSTIDDSKIGDLSSLTTNKKDTIVGAINELDKKKINTSVILKTQEEVEANTNPENVASAVVVGEVINNLGGCQLTQEGEDFYIVGADSVRKKLGSENVAHIISFQHTSPAGARYPSYKITWDVKKAKKVTFIYNASEGNVSALYYIGNSSYFSANKGANTIDISQVNTFSLSLSHDTVSANTVGVSDITFV